MAMMGNQLPPGMQTGFPADAAGQPANPYFVADLAERIVMLEEQIDKLKKHNNQSAMAINSLMGYIMSVTAILFDKVYSESPPAMIQKFTADVNNLMDQIASNEAAAAAASAAAAAAAADPNKGIPSSINSFEFSMD